MSSLQAQPYTRVYAWGNNSSGQLGRNTSAAPYLVPAMADLYGKTIVSVSVGVNHTLALASDGTIYAWGSNGSGQLGNNSNVDSAVPVVVNTTNGVSALFGKTVTAVVAGYVYSMALASDGTVYSWGDNLNFGRLGNGTSTGSSLVPVAVSTSGVLSGKTIIAITAGQQHALALASDGTMYTWGANCNVPGNTVLGQLGANSSALFSNVPVAVLTSGVLSGKTITRIGSGAFHCLAGASDGTLYGWGYNDTFQVGDGTNTWRREPVAVTMSGALAGKTIISLKGGNFHSLVLASDGTMYTWGNNSGVPSAVGTGDIGSKTVTAIGTGIYHNLALTSDGAVYAWGNNSASWAGAVGDNSTTDRALPVAVNTTSGLSALAGATVLSLATGSNASHSVVIASSNVFSPPDAPINVSATATIRQVTVTIAPPPSTGGSEITGYTVTASPGGATMTGTALSYTFTGLSNLVTYTFTATATNANGTSVASTATSAVTPTVPQAITTFAGSGTPDSTDATGALAGFNLPYGVTIDAAGNLYIADSGNHLIRKITTAGVVTTFAGSGIAGSTDETSTAASFNTPKGLAIDSSGNLYVADSGNHKIRMITSAGVVSTLAGSGIAGATNATGSSASFNTPSGVAVDSSGTVYVADYNNNTIRKITAGGVVTTYAGGTLGFSNNTGTSARFNHPSGVAVDSAGIVYVADTGTHTIRKIATNTVVTSLAGTGNIQGFVNATGTSARFRSPSAIAVDSTGNVYVADSGNHAIRKIPTAGLVTTLGGSGSSGSTDGFGSSGLFNTPSGVAVSTSGVVYVADYNNHKIRQVASAVPALTSATTASGAAGSDFSYQSVFSNTPTSYSASGLPSGLSVDTSTGAISGTPTVTGTFVVTLGASNAVADGTGSLTFTLIAGQTITFGSLGGKTYGDAAFTVNATASSNLTPTLSIVSGPATISGNTITLTGVGTVVVRASQSGNSTYAAATPVDQGFTVAKAPLTVTADARSRSYGSANPSLSVTISGFVNSETVSVLGGSPGISTSATSSSIVGGYAITPSLGTLTATNYDFTTFTPGTLTITQAPLTVTADARTRVYGASNPALSATITGFVNGETAAVVSGAAALSTTATATSTVTSTYPITPALGTLSATNYGFTTFTPGTLTVTKSPLTVTADAQSRTYGAANPALTATITGFVNGETNSVVSGAPALTTTASATSNVATTYPITPTSGTLSATNYAFTTFTPGTLTVTKAPLTVTADAKSRAFGVADPSFTATITGFVNGETVAVVSGAAAYTTNAVLTSPVGPYTITPALGTLGADNYAFATFTDGVLTVGQTSQTLTFAALANKTYGDAAFAVTPTASSSLPPTLSVLSGPATISGSTVTLTGAGLVSIRATQTGDANYTAATAVDRSFTVTKAPLTVTADAKHRGYGAADPTFTTTITGFVNADTIAVVSGAATATSTATATSNAGAYPITPAIGTLSAANYDFITFTPGTLTVAAAALTATAANHTRVHGAANPVLTITYSGFLNGDTVLALTTVPSASTAATSSSDVGVYPISITGGTSDRYTLNRVNGTLTISKATQTVTFAPLPSSPTAGVPFTISASASSGLPVTFAVVSGNAGLTGSTVTINDTSPVVLRATQAGDTNRASATVDVTVSAVQQTQTITFASLASATTATGPITLGASASSGLPVTYALVSGPATVSGHTITLSGATGVVSVQAQQAGNATYSAAPSVTQIFTVSSATAAPVIVQSPASVNLNVGQNSTLTVVAIGEGTLSYRWLKDGVALPGASNASLALLDVTAATAGAYRAEVTNLGGTTFSAPASVTISEMTTAPVIFIQPAPQTAQPGANVNFSVLATGNPAPAYSWRKNSAAISGANGAVLTLTNVQAADAASYDVVVSNSAGSAISSFTPLIVSDSKTAPIITRQPANISALVGATVILDVAATGSPAPTYQWQKEDAVVPGATGATLSLADLTSAQAGKYSVIVSNSEGSVASRAVTLAILKRSYAGTYFGTLSGGGTFALYIRDDNTGVLLGYAANSNTAYVNQELSVDDEGRFTFTSIAGAAAVASTSTSRRLSTSDSIVALATEPVASTGAGTIATDGNISGSIGSVLLQATKSATGATQTLAGFYSAGAANSSAQTLTIVGSAGQTFVLVKTATSLEGGVGSVTSSGQVSAATANGQIVGAIDAATSTVTATITRSNGQTTSFTGTADDASAVAEQRLLNLSTRARAGSGERVAIVGFVIRGDESKTVLIRAAGPALAAFGVEGPLASPALELYRGSTLLAANSGWSKNTNSSAIVAAASRAGAFAFGSGSGDSAVLTTLPPGAYTATVSSSTGAAGVTLVEVYDLSGATAGEKLINLSTRAFAGAASDTVIAGVVIGGTTPKRVLIRAAGPALARYGLAGTMTRPTLKLYSGATVVAQNTGWSTSADAVGIAQAAVQVGAFVYDSGSADSAMLLNLFPGSYTAQVSGSGSDAGVILIEVYEVP